MNGEINDKTRVGLYAVMGILPVVTAFAFFIAGIYYKAEASEVRLDRHADAIREQRIMLINISERTARIETLLTTLTAKK